MSTRWGQGQDDKKAALKEIFETYTDGDFARKIAKENEQLTADAMVANGSIGSWRTSTPRDHRWFFNNLVEKLKETHDASPDLSVSIVFRTSYEDFLNYLSEKHRRILTRSSSGTTEQVVAIPGSQPFQPLWFKVGEKLETIQDGISRGRVDQKHYYLSPESAHRWMALIDSRAYQTYEECLAGLRALTKSESWNSFLREGQWGGAVMLGGGGAPSKDIVVIESLLKYTPPTLQPIEYTLVDISPYMIEQSFHWLDRILKARDMRTRVNLKTVRWDFMDMQAARPLLREQGKSLAWFLTGQTLGNIDEKRFFDSVQFKTQPGDIVIIGTEFIDNDEDKQEIERNIKKFDNPEMRDFLRMPILSVCSVLDTGTRLEEALKRIKVRIVDGFAAQHSAVSKTHSVEIFIHLNNTNITLVTSTRYNEAALVEYAAHFKLGHLETIASPQNPNYRHVCFRREE